MCSKKILSVKSRRPNILKASTTKSKTDTNDNRTFSLNNIYWVVNFYGQIVDYKPVLGLFWFCTLVLSFYLFLKYHGYTSE